MIGSAPTDHACLFIILPTWPKFQQLSSAECCTRLRGGAERVCFAAQNERGLPAHIVSWPAALLRTILPKEKGARAAGLVHCLSPRRHSPAASRWDPGCACVRLPKNISAPLPQATGLSHRRGEADLMLGANALCHASAEHAKVRTAPAQMKAPSVELLANAYTRSAPNIAQRACRSSIGDLAKPARSTIDDGHRTTHF
eukprot:1605368-Rhodomonas_salina.1